MNSQNGTQKGALPTQDTQEISVLEIAREYHDICNIGSESVRQDYFAEQVKLIRGVRGNAYTFFSVLFNTVDCINILDALAVGLELSEEYFDPLIQQEAENTFIEDTLIPEFRTIYWGSEEVKMEYLLQRVPLILNRQVHNYRMFQKMFQVSAPEEMIAQIGELLEIEEKRVEEILQSAKNA